MKKKEERRMPLGPTCYDEGDVVLWERKNLWVFWFKVSGWALKSFYSRSQRCLGVKWEDDSLRGLFGNLEVDDNILEKLGKFW